MSASQILAKPLVWLIRAYQVTISSWTPRTCKYYPTCSAYALGCLQKHGIFKGTALAVWRVLRCNPWSRGGYDRIPGTPDLLADQRTTGETGPSG